MQSIDRLIASFVVPSQEPRQAQYSEKAASLADYINAAQTETCVNGFGLDS